jgi:hypothetical protein
VLSATAPENPGGNLGLYTGLDKTGVDLIGFGGTRYFPASQNAQMPECGGQQPLSPATVYANLSAAAAAGSAVVGVYGEPVE